MPEWTYRGYAPEPLSVSDQIIRGIDEGRIALPEFQRDFDWDQKRIVSLLTSVARRWPIGTLLVVQGEHLSDLGWGRRALEGAPHLNSPNMLVLDGQQRLTALYHAIRDDVSEDVYYCHIARVLESGELDDDDIVSDRKSRFQKEYPDKSAEAAHGIIRISSLFFDDRFDEWLRYIDEDRRSEMIRIRRGPLAGLREDSYSIPAIRLEGEVPLVVVAKIFETTNSGAMVLGTFDLMVAKLYPRSFNLREKWMEAQSLYGFPDRMELDALQVIALRENLRSPDQRRSGSVKGIRQSDILELDADLVIEEWEQSVTALDHANKFMIEHCGAVRPNLIPSDTMRIPLAFTLWDTASLSDERVDRIRRWFWSTTVLQTYAQGANTQAVTDARALRRWDEEGETPSIILEDIPEDLPVALKDTLRRNQMLARGVLCLLISRGAHDWAIDRQLGGPNREEEIDRHHVFPANYVRTAWNDDGNIVANFTPLFAKTNRSLRSDHPKAVIDRNDVRTANIWQHQIPQTEFETENWPAFIERRVEMLTKAFREELAS